MSGPDPFGIWVQYDAEGNTHVVYEQWDYGNRKTRQARASSILRNLKLGWLCPVCFEPVPIYRRADAAFCSERCRKKQARKRRKIATIRDIAVQSQ